MNNQWNNLSNKAKAVPLVGTDSCLWACSSLELGLFDVQGAKQIYKMLISE